MGLLGCADQPKRVNFPEDNSWGILMMNSTRRQRLEELLADAPDDPEIHYALAMEDLNSNDLEAAVRRFQELARGPQPHVPSFLMGAQTLLKLGRERQAIDLLQQGIKVAAEQGNLHAQGEMQGLLDSLK
jgi:predicted Zn-dependent protease